MEATIIRKLGDWRNARLYQLSQPHPFTSMEKIENGDDFEYVEVEQTCDYVVSSAVDVPFSGPETLVFAADAYGNVLCWSELTGVRGALNHDEAIRRFLDLPRQLEA